MKPDEKDIQHEMDAFGESDDALRPPVALRSSAEPPVAAGMDVEIKPKPKEAPVEAPTVVDRKKKKKGLL